MTWFDRPASDTGITHRGRLWLYAIATLVMAFLILPTLIVIPMSFSASQYLEFPPRQWSWRWYAAYINSPEWMQATRTSIVAGLFTSALATPLGALAAYGAHTARLRLAQWITPLLLAPLVVPLILIGIGVFYVYVRLKLVNTMTGLVLAHAMLAVPLVFMIVSSALKSFDMSQELVARSLGAPRAIAILLVTLPQLRFAITAAAVLAFLTSFDEVVLAMFISGGDNATLTRAMFNALRDQVDPTIAAISTVMIVISSALVIGTQLLGGRDGKD